MSAGERRYAMTRLRRGDYLLPSNDARTLYRLYAYEEDGSAEWADGKKLTGMWWAVARRPFPQPGRPFDLEAWDEWEHVAGPLATRDDAIKEALRLG